MLNIWSVSGGSTERDSHSHIFWEMLSKLVRRQRNIGPSPISSDECFPVTPYVHGTENQLDSTSHHLMRACQDAIQGQKQSQRFMSPSQTEASKWISWHSKGTACTGFDMSRVNNAPSTAQVKPKSSAVDFSNNRS